MRKEDRVAAGKRQGREEEQIRPHEPQDSREQEEMKGRGEDEQPQKTRRPGEKLPLPD